MLQVYRPPNPVADDNRFAIVRSRVNGRPAEVEFDDNGATWWEPEVPADWVEMLPGEVPAPPILARNLGTHQTHCCPKHGCCYGAIDCPVQLGTLAPEYPKNNGCEGCEYEREEAAG